MMQRQQVQIQNLVIQNHGSVQENNKIININTNALICNKENIDANVKLHRKHNNIPTLNTQKINTFKEDFELDPRSTKNNH